MQKRILPLVITTAFLISLIGWSCTKLDTTDIGSDLLPAVDNVHTFADTLLINTTQGFFNDSTAVGRYDDQAIGRITNDPLFGTTNANIYMQLKPPFYPYYYGNAGDTIVGFDSVVLCLKYVGFWGDSTLPVNLDVREVVDNEFRDSTEKLNTTAYRPTIGGASLGSVSIDPRRMKDTIYLNNKRDKVINQIRIKLNNPFASQLFSRDSLKNNAANNAFYNDSIYRRFYNGIGVIATGGSNGLLYVRLADTATKLEVHYRKKNGGSVDSVYSSLRFNPVLGPLPTNAPASNVSNYIERNRTGYPVKNNTDPNVHYLQTSPGTYITLNIPALATLSNRVIHRAEIIVEQIPSINPLDEILSPPNFLYLDLKDTGSADKWKPVYFDLNTSANYDPDYKNGAYFVPKDPTTGGLNIDFNYFGAYKKNKVDLLSGFQHKYYTINISRYVQQIVTKHTRSYDMRLYAPFDINYPQYNSEFLSYGNNIAFGRVKIGSGSNPNYRLRLRIVYSKL